jgi:hypothetical protein
MVLALLWLDDEQASLEFGTTRVFTVMDGTSVDTTKEERRPQCLRMSLGKFHKLLRKTRRSKVRYYADIYVIHISLTAELPAEFHHGEELIV